MARSGGDGSPWGAVQWLAFFPSVAGFVLLAGAMLTMSSGSGWEVSGWGRMLVWPGLVCAAFGVLVAVLLMVAGSVRQWPTNGWLWIPAAVFPLECATLMVFVF